MADRERQSPRAEQFRRESYKPSVEGRVERAQPTAEQQESAEKRLRAKEAAAEAMRQSAFEKVPALMPYLEGGEADQVMELAQQFEALSEQKKSEGLSAEEYASKKRDIFIKMNVVLDRARDRIQDEEEESAAVQEDADTGFVENMSAVEAQRAEQASQVEEQEEPAQETVESTEDAAAWDAYAQQMMDWAVKRNLYNMDLDEPDRVWRPDLTNEELLQTTGLDQAQLFTLTKYMIRRKQRAISNKEQAA